MAPAQRSRPKGESRRGDGNRPASPPVAPIESAATALRHVRERLEIIRAVIVVSRLALDAQAADADHDIAVTLRRCVTDELERQIEQIDGILGVCRDLDPASAIVERAA